MAKVNNRDVILIVDSADTRRQDLSQLWHELGYDVAYYSGGDWFKFGSAEEPQRLDSEKVNAAACLFHASDGGLYSRESVQNVVARCSIVVAYSGGGPGVGSELPKGWPRITREVRGPNAATHAEWEQLRDWLFSKSRDSDPLPMLLAGEPRYLQALYILCEGCLAVLRADVVRTEAKGKVLSREWWSVPLLKTTKDLAKRVAEEWGEEVPAEVGELCRWIAHESSGAHFPCEKLEGARVAIHKRLSCL